VTTAADLAGASDAEIAAARTALTAYLAARYPTLSVRACQLSDLVLGPSADALAAVDHRADEREVALDPATALATGGYDVDTLNAALAGRGVVRGAAAAATGSAALVFSSSLPVQVRAGMPLTTADGTVYKTTAARRLLAPGTSPSADGDVVMVATVAGAFEGLVPVAAAVAAAAGNRAAGAALTAAAPLPRQTGAYAATDFTGGADAETDAALLLRLPAATAPRTTATAAGAEALVQETIPGAVTSAVGYGHAAMRRGRSVLTGQTPGRLDVWVRTATELGRARVAVTATLESTGGGHGTWRAELTPAAGLAPVAVEKALQSGDTLTAVGYTPATVTWGYDTATAAPGLDIKTPADARFGSYSSATVRFVDTDTDTTAMTVGVTTRDYDLVVRHLDGVPAAQVAGDAPGARTAGGDCEIRAACPALVTLTADVTTPAGVTLTTAAARAAVAAAVNGNGVSSTLNGAAVTARAQAFLPAGCVVTLSDWAATVNRTTDAPVGVTGAAGLALTDDYDNGVSDDTVAFYCDQDGVTATVTTG
jgi:hypothetical protein